MTAYTAQISKSTVSSSPTTAGHLRAPGSGMRRLKIFEFDIGATSAPNATDCNLTATIKRTTSNGTDTAYTPNPLDPADAACVATFGQNASIESIGITANSELWSLGFNQRASYRWIAKDGKELVIPATANAGAVMLILSPNYTGNFAGPMYFEE